MRIRIGETSEETVTCDLCEKDFAKTGLGPFATGDNIPKFALTHEISEDPSIWIDVCPSCRYDGAIEYLEQQGMIPKMS